MAKKTPNRQDATLVNVRAAKARQSALAKRMRALEAKVETLDLMVQQLLTRLA